MENHSVTGTAAMRVPQDRLGEKNIANAMGQSKHKTELSLELPSDFQGKALSDFVEHFR